MQLPYRISQLCDALEREAAQLPTSRANIVRNAIARARLTFKKAGMARPSLLGDTASGPRRHDIARRDGQVISLAMALLDGRRLSYKDSDEFGVVEWHTRMADVRRRFQERHDVRLASRWVEDNAGTRFKEYWAEPVEGNQEQTLFS